MDSSELLEVALAVSNSSSKSFIPIASLEEPQNLSSDLYIRGVVTLIWPYSSSTGRAALLIAEEDFRLRKRKGQVRIQLRGAAARAVASSGINIGDLVEFSLDGVYWTDDTGHIKTPGRSVDGELVYRKRIKLEIFREQTSVANIDVLDVESPLKASSVSPAGAPLGIKATPTRPTVPTSWSSPVFLHSTPQSVSSTPGLVDDLFADGEDFPEEREKKRRKAWKPSQEWTYIDGVKSREEADTLPSRVEAASPQSTSLPISTPSRAPLREPRHTLLANTSSSMPPPRLGLLRGTVDEVILTPPRPILKPIMSPDLPVVSPFVTSSQSSYFMQSHRAQSTSLLESVQIYNQQKTRPAQEMPTQASDVEPVPSQERFESLNSPVETTAHASNLSEIDEKIRDAHSSGPATNFSIHQRNAPELSVYTEAAPRPLENVESDDADTEQHVHEKDVLSPDSLVIPDNVQTPVVFAKNACVVDDESSVKGLSQDAQAENKHLIGSTGTASLEKLSILAPRSRDELSFEDVFILSPALPDTSSQPKDEPSSEKGRNDSTDDPTRTLPTLEKQTHRTDLLPTPDASQTVTEEPYASSTPIDIEAQNLQTPALITPQTSDLHQNGIFEDGIDHAKPLSDIPSHSTKRRRSIRISNYRPKVPEVVSPWFVARRSQLHPWKLTDTSPNISVHETLPPEPKTPAEVEKQSTQFARDHSMSTLPSLDRVPDKTLKSFRTKLTYFTPLCDIYQHLNNRNGQSLDVLSVAHSQHSKPAKSKNGPKDYYVTFSLTDHSIFPDDVLVRVFRPSSAALPTPNAGDIVLLRAVAVKSNQRKPMLISQELSSGWCVWRSSIDDPSGERHQRIDDRFTEAGEEEQAIANELQSWWRTLSKAQQVTGDLTDTSKP